MPGHGASATKISTDLTLLFLIIRLWDAVNDPLWGIIVDTRKPTKNGKFRPYLKAVTVPLALSTVLCFLNLQNMISSYALLLAFAYVTYCIFGMMYTAMNIPYGALASAITDDPNGRTLLSTFRSIGSGVGGAAVTLVAQKLIYDDGTKLNSSKNLCRGVRSLRSFHSGLHDLLQNNKRARSLLTRKEENQRKTHLRHTFKEQTFPYRNDFGTSYERLAPVQLI